MTSRATRKRQLSTSNYSPVGWYVVTLLERFEFGDNGEPSLEERVKVWENTVLVQASTPDEAHAKAMSLGKMGNQSYKNVDGERVRVVFEGISSLIPVYDELKHGAELFWRPHSVKLKTLRAWVKDKNDLESIKRDA